MNTSESISPERLVQASIAAMKAGTEYEAEFGSFVYPADLMGHEDQPRELCEFTRTEIEEACAFLVRLGFMEPRKAA